MNREEIAGAVARGWCHPTTENRVMDADLAMAITSEVWDLLNPPNLGCATTRQLLAELTTRIEIPHHETRIGRSPLDYRTVDSHA